MNRENLPDNPLHRASFFLENLKKLTLEGKAEEKAVTGVQIDTTYELLGTLLKLAENDSITPEELWASLAHYGERLHQMMGGPQVIVLSIFVDGFLHGLAMQAGLEAEVPNGE